VSGTAAPRPDIEEQLTKADPDLGRIIAAVIERVGPQRITPSQTAPFEALVRAIVYQSISGKAAVSIYARLKAAVKGSVAPAELQATAQDTLTGLGLSKSKASVIRSLAEWFAANREFASALPALPDDEVIATLTGITGIGVWTVNVFLIFNLGRLDVLPAADLGIRRGVQLAYGLPNVATANQVRERADLWRPYRSVASTYLWNAVKLKLSPATLEER
jgi:3-methyladenine DNA glycosylase/8-oxoguanine DNA glycosylase